MVYRIYVEKKPELAHEAKALKSELVSLLGIKGLEDLRIINRYDAENITEELFRKSVLTVFSEPQLDIVYDTFSPADKTAFAVEYLPGQFDQRADSAAQCIQLSAKCERPTIHTAKIYLLSGNVADTELEKIKKYVINPVEARETGFDLPETLGVKCEIPDTVKTLDGFTKLTKEELSEFVKTYGLAMDADDIAFCQKYFISEHRDPTITEIRMIDTYWSDHCRHTTFLTVIDNVTFEDKLLQDTYDNYLAVRKQLGRTRPICLMDLATIAVKALKKEGKLDKLDESEEINACTVKINVEVDGVVEPWLLLFKNETHNHPTEIEPFGGAATCIGGAIRDPLSGRAYVYGAMRVTGAADPTKPIEQTISGKLPQRKIVTTAAAGYSSYGNQIGLATGIVDEIYHPGYAAKRMEIGAVIAATPEKNVRREVPAPGDVVILLGGATGRDGCGGATGSSKSHTAQSLETCGAEVQKGNAPEERKLQRLFRNYDACRMIKRCNDFGAGGVSVAIGELADGLHINLDLVPKKYDGLDGTELAISESQERMAVVVEKENVEAFLALANSENLAATPVATVTKSPRLVMEWKGNTIVDVSREFLNSNGADKHISITAENPKSIKKAVGGSFLDNLRQTATDLNTCSKRGLSERFDSTIGAGTVLMPFGGKNQLTPIQAMVQKISVEKKHTDDCSLMAFGYNPFIAEQSPYHGAYLAVVESVCKLIACGADFKDVYLTFQEYFKHPGKDGTRWSQPLSALLGAFRAQMDLGIGAIGGKDSMSGTFENINVPPTLVSFAVTTSKTDRIVSPEFKKCGNKLILIKTEYDENGLPKVDSLKKNMALVSQLLHTGKAVSCYTPGMGGIAEAVMKMSLGNSLGFKFSEKLTLDEIFGYSYASFLLETTEASEYEVIGEITKEQTICHNSEEIALDALLSLYENKLEGVYPCNIQNSDTRHDCFSYVAKERCAPAVKVAKPRVLIPVFPGTNCEYDSAKAVSDAGAEAEILVINNLTTDGIKQSVERFSKELSLSQMVFIPGGFSGGDEPEGSAKFITAFMRNPEIKDGITELLEKRDGLMCGICNGFQALIKLGLVPFGKITEPNETYPTLTYNTISRHQSRIVRTRICSNKSPWLSLVNVGDIINVPISHGEGRFICDESIIKKLAENGQIATQYVDLSGEVSNDIHFTPNDSAFAIEGITSPDGRVFGKMGHSERVGSGLYKNVPGNYDIRMFESAVKYFK